MKEKDVKVLWGRAGGLCSLCKTRVSQESADASSAVPLGEAAHIVGESSEGPRGVSTLTADQRDGYTNRILLCPTCHRKVDKLPGDFPIERLHILKREHELWVEQQLAVVDERVRVGQEVYASLIDAAVEACDFADWHLWSSRAMASYPRWSSDRAAVLYSFRQRICGAAWPGQNLELERALQTLSICMNAAAQRFLAETEEQGDERVEVRYYRNAASAPAYHMLFARWEQWAAHMELLIREATKAANWVAEIVRRDLNPGFFAVAGKFYLTIQDGLSFVTVVPEFTADEKATLPSSLDLTQPEVPAEPEE